MAIYWIDPYIDAPIGGIHGTVDGTTRDGSYAYPFKFKDDFYTSNSSLRNSVNGVTIQSGDEIRIKGLPLEDYYFDVSTANNLIPVDSCNQNFFSVDNTLHASDIATYKSHINSFNSKPTGVLIYHDAGLVGARKWFVCNTSNAFGIDSTANRIQIYSNDYNFTSGWIRAKNGISSGVDSFAFLDYNYVIEFSNSSSRYLFKFSRDSGIKITDGWTSSTQRDGITIIAIDNVNFNGAPSYNYIGDGSNSRTGKNTTVVDLRNTYFLSYTSKDYRAQNRTYFYYSGYTGESDSFVKWGQFGDQSGNSWSYHYYNTDDNNISIGTEYPGPIIEYGILGEARYSQLPVGASYFDINRPTIKFDNLMHGRAPYSQGNRYNFEVGNMFVYTQYSSDALYPNLQPTCTYRFYGHFYGFSGMANFTNTAISNVSDFTGSTNFNSNNLNYPGSGGGPLFSSTIAQSSYFYTKNIIKLETLFWYDATAITLWEGNRYTYSGQVGQICQFPGILECNNVNYRNVDPNILLKNHIYNENSYFADQDITICNDYDDNIISFFTLASNSQGGVYPMIMCYNDTPGELTVQCNSNATLNWYNKAFSIAIEGGKPTSGTLNISLDIEYDFTADIQPRVYFFVGTTSVNASYSISGNIISYYTSYSVGSNNITDTGYAGALIAVRNVGGHNNKYYIKNFSATVS